jgi:hypothetical protein
LNDQIDRHERRPSAQFVKIFRTQFHRH